MGAFPRGIPTNPPTSSSFINGIMAKSTPMESSTSSMTSSSLLSRCSLQSIKSRARESKITIEVSRKDQLRVVITVLLDREDPKSRSSSNHIIIMSGNAKDGPNKFRASQHLKKIQKPKRQQFGIHEPSTSFKLSKDDR